MEKTKELYNDWNEQKVYIELQNIRTFFKERDIFYLRAWKNVWFEQNWKWGNFSRPFLVLKKFNNETFWWVPLSSKTKEWKYYHNFILNNIPQTAIISQMRLIDSKRILDKIWMIDKINYDLIKQKIKNLL